MLFETSEHSYKYHVTNEEVRRIQDATEVHDGKEAETQLLCSHLKIILHML